MTLSAEAQANLNSILAALDEQMQLNENAAYQAALKYYTVLSCFGSSSGGGGSTDISTLATEATATAINNKIPDLSSDRVPVVLGERILTPDRRIVTANETIPEGSIYCYMKVLVGSATVGGLLYATNEYINYESCYPCKHAAISIVISEGGSVRLDRGF